MIKLPTVEKLRAKVSPQLRQLFDSIWNDYLRTQQWPVDRAIYGNIPQPKLLKLTARIDGRYIQEVESHPNCHFELMPLGVLCTSQGNRYVDLLYRYLKLARDVYFDTTSNRRSISSADATAGLNLSDKESIELGKVLCVRLLNTGPGHANDWSTWEDHFPSGLKKIGKRDDVLPLLKELIESHCSRKQSIWLETRRGQLHALSLNFDRFEPTPLTLAKTRKTRARPTMPARIRDEVIFKARRRCCLCSGLNSDLSVKDGQIAHLDGNRSNHSLGNLAFLCLDHHNAFDSKPSQAAGFTIKEVKRYRSELWEQLRKKRNSPR